LMNQGVCFENIVGVTGSLEFVVSEMTRRFINEYENLKLEKNGDVPEYAEILQWLRLQRQENYDHAPDTTSPHG
jgi:hypothetical protein